MSTYQVWGHHHTFPTKKGKATIRLGNTGLSVERVVYTRACLSCQRSGEDFINLSGKEVRVYGWGTEDVYVKSDTKLPKGAKVGDGKDESKPNQGESLPSEGGQGEPTSLEWRVGSSNSLRNSYNPPMALGPGASEGPYSGLMDLYNELDEEQTALYQAISAKDLGEVYLKARKVAEIALKIAFEVEEE